MNCEIVQDRDKLHPRRVLRLLQLFQSDYDRVCTGSTRPGYLYNNFFLVGCKTHHVLVLSAFLCI